MNYKRNFKRFFDITFALIAMPILLVLLLPIAILIKFEDGGAIFYNAYRLGKDNKLFKMYKFRSMKINSPDFRLADGSTFNSKNDPRVTKIGKFLRESSIDELPQFLNVIIGDMSIVGPRPDIKSNEKQLEEFNSYLNVKPGITGYNQAYFRNESNRLEKIKNDKFYEENVSFTLDLKILYQTIKVVLKKDKMYKL